MRPIASGPHSAWFGLIFVGIGALLIVMVRYDPGAAQAPVWVVEAAGAAFALAGLSFVAQAFGQHFLARLFGLALIYTMAVPGLWTLFDSNATCSVGMAISGTAIGGGAPSWTCRAVFGAGAIIVLLAALAFTWQMFARKPKVTEPSANQP